MTTLDKATALAKAGFYLFPVRHGADNTKTPLTPHGHRDATTDLDTIKGWWKKNPDAKPGVACGKSGIIVADVDVKGNKDGWRSLEEAWLDLGEPFSYETSTGGSHLVYLAPEVGSFSPSVNYRGMDGVDVRAGESWILWAGDVPSKEDLNPAPAWLLDESKPRVIQGFEGNIAEWYDSLVPGDPNVMVRRAIKAIPEDPSHADMVARTFEAIRLGAEGSTGVPELIDAIEDAWMSRPAENHSTPENLWTAKFQEALLGGLEKYGEATDLLKSLPEFSLALVPTSVPDNLVTGTATGKTGYSQVLGALVKEIDDDVRIVSILWNAPATRDLAREWGLQFNLTRVQEARKRPEPTRENPRLEEKRAEKEPTTTAEPVEREDDRIELLTQDERDFIRERPSFSDFYLASGQETGFANEKYFRACSWSVSSMAFSFHGFIPVTATDKIGLNLWDMVLGMSGTGKSRALKFRDGSLRAMFNSDNEEGIPYDLGTDSSPQGLHMALLQRDRKASFFGADEASGFFKQLNKTDWMSNLDDTLSDWYEGYVRASSKISLKELKGKSAQTALVSQMFATPDRLTEVLTRDMFLTGFLARYQWIIGDPPVETDSRFNLLQQEDPEDFDEAPEVIKQVVADLVAARSFTGDKAFPLLATQEALVRMSEAYKKMYKSAKGRSNFDIIEPSVTRLMEAMRKCAGICAMYRSDTTIQLEDALHAIENIEERFNNLFIIADMVSAGMFQRDVNAMEEWIISRGGEVTKAQLFYRFKNMVERDPRELESRIAFLVESGIVNKQDGERGGVRYSLNG